VTLDELKRFCVDGDDIRYGLQQPWTRDGYTWASNGYLVVRVPAIAEVPDNEKAPSIAKLFSETAPPGEWVAVPTVAAPELDGGDVCYGDGQHECDCGHLHECGTCNGSGEVRAKALAIAVGNSNFADRYLHMIQGWEIAPNGKKAAWIRKDDALGLLMPMRM